MDTVPSTSSAPASGLPKSKALYYRRCYVPSCRNTKENSPGLSFFAIPLEDTRRTKWLHAIGRQDLHTEKSLKHCVCETHFEKRDIKQVELLRGGVRHNLRRDALPCLRISPTSSPSHHFPPPTTQPIAKAGIRRERAPPPTLKDLLQIERMFSNLDVRKLIANAAELKARLNLKKFCSDLYHCSRESYVMLQKPLGLMPIKKVKKLTLPMSTHLSKELLTSLKLKVDKMSQRERNCVIVMGATDLKRNLYYNIGRDRIVGLEELDGAAAPAAAACALVLAARGLLARWAQPVALALLAELRDAAAVVAWVVAVIDKLAAIGLTVRAYLPDMDVLRLSVGKHIDAETHYFTRKNKKIYVFYDPPWLMKNIYYYLLSHTLVYDDNRKAKMEHITEFYELDKNNSVRLAEKLTDDHVKPSNIDQLKVRQAVEVVSEEVARGLAAHAQLGALPPAAADTAHFLLVLSQFHKLFSKEALYGKDNELEIIFKTMSFVKCLRIFDVNGEEVQNVHLGDGFETNAHSLLMLLQDLEAEGYQYIVPKALSKNLLRVLFRKIKARYAKGCRPTSRQFLKGFRALYFSKRLPSGNFNAKHFENFLVNLRKDLSNRIAPQKEDLEKSKPPECPFVNVQRTDYNQLNIQPNEPLFQVCGQLLRVASPPAKGACCWASNTMDTLKILSKEGYRVYWEYIKSNDYTLAKIPSDKFVFFVESLERRFCSVFEAKGQKRRAREGPALGAYRAMEDLTYPCSCCSCINSDHLKKIFIRMRLYFLVKHNNMALRKGQEFTL